MRSDLGKWHAAANLRAVGAFLISAEKKNGKVVKLHVLSEKGGLLEIISPDDGSVLTYETKPGKWIKII